MSGGVNGLASNLLSSKMATWSAIKSKQWHKTKESVKLRQNFDFSARFVKQLLIHFI